MTYLGLFFKRYFFFKKKIINIFLIINYYLEFVCLNFIDSILTEQNLKLCYKFLLNNVNSDVKHLDFQ